MGCLGHLCYVQAMGMGSLATYRKIIMVIGFSIFLLGAVGRWHHKRQMGAVTTKSRVAEREPSLPWLSECVSYACRPLGAKGDECTLLCERASADGVPTVQAERIALACRRDCTANEQDSECQSACFVREAKASIGR